LRKKKVLSKRELEVEKILQELLPEYVIRANVRLADVLHAGNQFKWMSGYHLDFVICDENANVIAAVELDDSTHDTDDGRRRDSNKNRWLEKANIKLIRIRTLEEAQDIRELLTRPNTINRSSLHYLGMREANESLLINDGWERTSSAVGSQYRARKSNSMIVAIVIVIVLLWGVNAFLSNRMNKLSANTVAQQSTTQLQSESLLDRQKRLLKQQQDELAWKKRQEQEIELVRARIEAQQPHYERVLVKGKSARECSNGNVINNETIQCTKTHYEDILVNGSN